jgi:hypothetical protein
MRTDAIVSGKLQPTTHILAKRTRLMRLLAGDHAATASEYATIFAVIVIALMVCVNVVGRNLGRAVQSADAKLAGTSGGSFFAGPSGGGPASASGGNSKNKPGDKGAESDSPAYVRPTTPDDDRRPASEVQEKPKSDEKAPREGVDNVRRLFNRKPNKPAGKRE